MSVLVRARPAFLGTSSTSIGHTAWTSDSPADLRDPNLIGHWLRNIDLISIHYAFQPRVRTRLTLGGFTFPRKPWVYGERDFHPFYRYLSRHMHYFTLHGHFRSRFAAEKYALLPLFRVHSFGSMLIPDHYRRQTPRPVSYYALFK